MNFGRLPYYGIKNEMIANKEKGRKDCSNILLSETMCCFGGTTGQTQKFQRLIAITEGPIESYIMGFVGK